MKVALLRETFPGERRVALVPALIPSLAKQGWQTIVEAGAGECAGFPDAAYIEKHIGDLARNIDLSRYIL